MTDNDKRDLVLTLVAAAGELRTIIEEQLKSRYTGASIDFAYMGLMDWISVLSLEEREHQRQFETGLIRKLYGKLPDENR